MAEKYTSRESLAFPTPEHAKRFTKRVEERVETERRPDVVRDREIVAEELAKEFSHAGEEVSLVSTPWEHTKKEHEAAEHLVRVAFDKDIKAAIEQAKSHDSYPRNIDLLHDMLTTKLYHSIRKHGMTREALAPWIVIFTGVIMIAMLFLLYILILF